MPINRTILLAFAISAGLAVSASAQVGQATKIGDRQNCGHLHDPAMAARIGTLGLNPSNTRAMFAQSRDRNLGPVCAAYVARNICSVEWAEASISGLNALGIGSRPGIVGSVMSAQGADVSRNGAGAGAIAGGAIGALLGNSLGRGMTNDSALGGLLGSALVGSVGAVTGAAAGAGFSAQAGCKDLVKTMAGEINGMIGDGALYPVRTDAELRKLLTNWRGRLTDPSRVRTIDGILAHSDTIAARVRRNAAIR